MFNHYPFRFLGCGWSALAEVDCQELLDHLVGRDVTLHSLRNRIIAKAQGNLLFLEELVQSLAEAGSFEGEPGDYHLSKPAERIDIPLTIHTVLAARIDRLDGMPKTILQTSSVIGADVSIAPNLVQHQICDFRYVGVRTGPGLRADRRFDHDDAREITHGMRHISPVPRQGRDTKIPIRAIDDDRLRQLRDDVDTAVRVGNLLTTTLLNDPPEPHGVGRHVNRVLEPPALLRMPLAPVHSHKEIAPGHSRLDGLTKVKSSKRPSTSRACVTTENCPKINIGRKRRRSPNRTLNGPS
ncbi:hypothetical protein [Bradyrhizobium sp. SZCCHNRI3042]|uniref:hypothetical protein n=1 Tax=Bradyrhizobium sp. SZCCHNRI3042 TaxID=3057291 RepID=UPI0029168710|nr:hypothetical protein [Bradyrhizobium sp. SZCCHNRI3042]